MAGIRIEGGPFDGGTCEGATRTSFVWVERKLDRDGLTRAFRGYELPSAGRALHRISESEADPAGPRVLRFVGNLFRRCPECAELISRDANFCTRCGRALRGV